jgi:hypothetical protein
VTAARSGTVNAGVDVDFVVSDAEPQPASSNAAPTNAVTRRSTAGS